MAALPLKKCHHDEYQLGAERSRPGKCSSALLLAARRRVTHASMSSRAIFARRADGCALARARGPRTAQRLAAAADRIESGDLIFSNPG